MPLPANWSTVTVTGQYLNIDGTPLKGSVYFSSTVRLIDGTADVIVPPSVERAHLDDDGVFSVTLLATDDPDVAPQFYYQVDEDLTLPQGRRSSSQYLIQLPAASPTVDLADVVPVTDVAEVTPYLRRVDLGTSGGPAAADDLDALDVRVSGVEGSPVRLPAPSGADDTAAVSAVLSAHAGKRITGRPGAAYRISAPLVVYSGTTLDMTSCTVTLIADSSCNLLNNAAVAASGTRDTSITVRGGTWVRPAPNNATNGWDHHSLRFRRVDGLRIEDVRVETAVGKYAISLGDVTRYTVTGIDFAAFSDGVHIQGPAQHGYVGHIRGSTGDDMVAVTPRDWPAYDDVSGPVTDLVIEDVSGSSTAACLVKVLGGSPATSAQRIRVTGVSGQSVNHAVLIGDDSAQANTTGGLIDEVTVERVSVSAANNRCPVFLNGTVMRRVRIAGVTADNAAATTGFIRYSPATAGTLGALVVEGVDVQTISNVPIVEVGSNGTVARMIVDKVTVASTSSGASVVLIVGVVTDLTVSKVTGSATGSTNVLSMASGTATARVDRASISDVHLIGTGGSLVAATNAAHTLPRVDVTNVSLTGVGWLADLATTTELHLSSVTTASPGAGIINARATAVLTVKGSGLSLAAGGSGLAVASGGSVTARAFDLEVDASKLAKVANAMAFNTNAALSCGTGPIVCNGTNWKHLYTAAVY